MLDKVTRIRKTFNQFHYCKNPSFQTPIKRQNTAWLRHFIVTETGKIKRLDFQRTFPCWKDKFPKLWVSWRLYKSKLNPNFILWLKKMADNFIRAKYNQTNRSKLHSLLILIMVICPYRHVVLKCSRHEGFIKILLINTKKTAYILRSCTGKTTKHFPTILSNSCEEVSSVKISN